MDRTPIMYHYTPLYLHHFLKLCGDKNMALNKTRAGREYENVLKFFVVINNPIAGSPVFIKIRISCIRDAYFYQCMYCLSRISEKIVGGVYCTKFELILKAIPTNRTREARGGSKLNRTLNESPATASLHSASIRTRFCENYFLGIWISQNRD